MFGYLRDYLFWVHPGTYLIILLWGYPGTYPIIFSEGTQVPTGFYKRLGVPGFFLLRVLRYQGDDFFWAFPASYIVPGCVLWGYPSTCPNIRSGKVPRSPMGDAAGYSVRKSEVDPRCPTANTRKTRCLAPGVSGILRFCFGAAPHQRMHHSSSKGDLLSIFCCESERNMNQLSYCVGTYGVATAFITGDHANQDLRSTLKPIYSTIFTNHIWS